MDFMAAANQILILFIIMFIGLIAKKKNIINETVEKSISTLLIKIGLPSLVIASSAIQYSSEIIPNMLNIFLITLLSYVAIIAIGMLTSSLFKFDKNSGRVYLSLIVFANVGFMGYPLAKALYGDIGVFYTSIVNLVFTSFLWTYGILLYNSDGKINAKNLLNIGTVSSLITVLIFIFQIPIPAPVLSAFDLIGKMATPLSMIMIGSLIADINLKELFTDWRVYWTSLLKLILIPIATAIILKLLGYNEIVIGICTLMAAMPAGATNSIFAKEFDVNPTFASVGVFMTTLLSIATMPLILYFLTI
ncbi:MAG: Auxin Efflux Carrier [Clostridia bacterium]|jgi:predicted permease|nr:Auxin Efflux Carrier [Clostridia bacterium]